MFKQYLSFLVLIVLYIKPVYLINNVCPTYLDYYFLPIINPRCSYNPDIKDLPDLVTQHGFPLETYKITTEDGYILDLFRLPNTTTDKVAFLLHPATGSAAQWVDKGDSSLGYILRNQGYDVWLGNLRGSFYARAHETLSPDKDFKFWNFSFHEMGIYDIRSMLNFIKLKRDIPKKISFITHSMGANVITIYASVFPEEAEQLLNLQVLLAPSITLNYATTPVKLAARFAPQLYALANFLKIGEFLPHNNFTIAAQAPCRSVGMPFCVFIYSIAGGFDRTWPKPSEFPIAFTQAPAGVSVKTLDHYAQIINTKEFRKFDYGEETNEKIYGDSKPPLYLMEKVNVPTYVYVGENDAFASIKDASEFYNKLPDDVRKGFTVVENFNHYHFVYGNDLPGLIYNDVVDLVESVN